MRDDTTTHKIAWIGVGNRPIILGFHAKSFQEALLKRGYTATKHLSL